MLLEELIAEEQRITSPTSYAKASVSFAGIVSQFFFPQSVSPLTMNERRRGKKCYSALNCWGTCLGHFTAEHVAGCLILTRYHGQNKWLYKREAKPIRHGLITHLI